ncbi:hypothetical protein [Myxococcus landrumensis]|uniref:Lipoprotein n=1 Tax=Myxococcus landrumensis TaxID=2813577 RepID=A0ABX7NG32_9BACT|nr:hypothetical protein [Myxococcus landrumus]QSQ17792.1 hypothetical protein JY572_17915 [Myxococcus landrumus]
MRHALMCALLTLAMACGGPADDASPPDTLETTGQRMALFDYEAFSSTNNATDPNTSADSAIVINPNETVMIGTCVITGSAYTNDTYLRLLDASSNTLAYNDDHCAGLGSKLTFTAPAVVPPTYNIRAGCFAAGTCSGTVAISRRKDLFTFSAANTNNASLNTFNKQHKYNAGEIVRIGTCAYNASGATANGNTYLRLYYNNAGVYQQVAANDTPSEPSCGTAAEIVYTIPTSGYYQVRAGCETNTNCSGTVAVYTE